MAPVGIATSIAFNQAGVLDFDLIYTVQRAVELDLEVVQIYINESLDDDSYMSRLIDLLNTSGLDLVVHLPDLPKVTQKHLDNTKRLLNSLSKRNIKILIHYVENMTPSQAPVLEGYAVGIENSLTGTYPFQEHINNVLKSRQLARDLDAPFVFDPGRMLYVCDSTIEEIQTFIVGIVSELNPIMDVIHFADKTSWEKRFRECACIFPEGISGFLLDPLVGFLKKGGTIICEHEGEELMVQSILNLEESLKEL